jgi:lysophospholipase L1-like esterase
LIENGTGRAVHVENLAVDGTTTQRLLVEVRTVAQVRAAIAHADIVVIGIGGNELNEGDAALESGSCVGAACYDEPARRYRKNLGAIESEIHAIAADRVLLLRAIGMPNSLTGAEELLPAFLRPIATKVGAHQAELFDDATCAVTESHGGACARLREAFNGPRGSKDAYAAGLMNLDDCCYPSEAGHRLIAKILYAAGLGSLASK